MELTPYCFLSLIILKGNPILQQINDIIEGIFEKILIIKTKIRIYNITAKKKTLSLEVRNGYLKIKSTTNFVSVGFIGCYKFDREQNTHITEIR
jgi:hypothetical protein